MTKAISAKIISVEHTLLRTSDLPRLVSFYKKAVGLKQIIKGDYFNAFEVGDIHLCIMSGEQEGSAGFDLLSENVDGMRERLLKDKVDCTECEDDAQSGHRSFIMTDPDGNEIRINSAHKPLPEIP